ncbi:class I SAM-dependent methyltransferase [Aureimonas flava]|uniref:Class I SAM-dependent methyltransferase n=2 Tax=Aureimonas flava TaxID=2320271 RepID=A0A3A1WNV0_9HYPH|nr:class I SAM-dependent methyltransferase [Aureimonas flava]
MRLDRFWNLALFDPAEGYYTRRDPIGARGDFTTAPEISQMFGELLAAWAFAAWDGLGRPAPFVFAEAGPGRGTLMADMLRTLRQLDPAFLRAARVRLVEVSDRLAAAQAERLARFDLPLRRIRRVGELDEAPLILVANELLDAVAIRQFVFRDGAWRERRVVAADAGGFAFADGAPAPRVPAVLASLPPPAPGAVFEVSPERDALCGTLAGAIGARGGAALLIDYGHARSAHGDTLQALRRHAAASPLDAPGRADITSHVDWEQVARAMAAAAPLSFGLARQGDFLLRMGLRERAGRLGAPMDEQGRQAITAAAHRLAGTGPGEMGALFQVFGAASAPLALPPFAQPPVD